MSAARPHVSVPVITRGLWATHDLTHVRQATEGLEKKQREKYGADERQRGAYESWVKSSWSGPMLSKKAPGSNDAPKEVLEA